MSFKIIKNNCCGLDVHKTWIYACIGITDPNNRTEYKQARFSSFTKGLNELCDWLAKYNCKDVCMESTGKYWIPVFNILEKHNVWVTLSHPKYTKPMKGNKTDRKDAKWICDLYMCGMVKPSFIPPKDIQTAMEKQMKAERDRRAAILEAEGEKKSAVLRAEGEKEAAINRAEGDKQSNILRAEGVAQARILEADGEKEAINRIINALADKGKPDQYLIAMKYLETMKAITSGKDNKVVYMPYEATGILSSVDGIKQMFDSSK